MTAAEASAKLRELSRDAGALPDGVLCMPPTVLDACCRKCGRLDCGEFGGCEGPEHAKSPTTRGEFAPLPPPADFAKLRELADKATPGLWKPEWDTVHRAGRWTSFAVGPTHVIPAIDFNTDPDSTAYATYKAEHAAVEADAAFIAECRAGVPALLDAYDRAIGQLNRIRDELGWSREWYDGDLAGEVVAILRDTWRLRNTYEKFRPEPFVSGTATKESLP